LQRKKPKVAGKLGVCGGSPCGPSPSPMFAAVSCLRNPDIASRLRWRVCCRPGMLAGCRRPFN
jgi:hypothetical protein